MGKTRVKEVDAVDLLTNVLPREQVQPKRAEAKRPAPKMPAKRSTEVAVQEPRTPAKQRQELSPLALLAELSRDRNVLPEKMREILTMQKEIAAEERRMAFTRAKIAMRPHLPVIDENGKIDAQPKPGSTKRGYTVSHAKMIDINLAIKPILDEFGFDLWFEPDMAPDGRLLQIGHLDHIDGHGISCRVPMTIDASGGKNNQQGVGSSYRYAQRFATVFLLNLDSRARMDADDNAVAAGQLEKREATEEAVEKLTAKQVTELRKAIKECGVSEDAFCTKYEIEKIGDLPPGSLGDALQACAGFKAERARRASIQHAENQ